MFFIETLADLHKGNASTAEREVKRIVDKCPQMNGAPCAFHLDLARGNLLGQFLPMNGQMPLVGGRPTRTEHVSGVVFQEPTEMEAFRRWQGGEFKEVARIAARNWREALTGADLGRVPSGLRSLGVSGRTFASLAEVHATAREIIVAREGAVGAIRFACAFLNLTADKEAEVFSRYTTDGSPGLGVFAPYVAHVLTVELFFQLALAAHLISAERPSNRTDMAYLFYLPFCALFVSSDRLPR